MSYYQHHLFFCTNLRDNNKKCCASGQAVSLHEYAKKRFKKLGIHQQGGIRATASGCLGRCDDGPVVVIYPDNVWYSYQTKSDVDEIIEQHILKGEVVDRLLI